MGVTNFDSVTIGGDLNVSGTITGNVDVSSTLKFGDGEAIVDSNGNEEIVFGVTSSAVNEIKVTNAATGNAPSVKAQGGDNNVALLIAGKGTGAVQLGQATSVGVTLVADQPILDSSANELVKFSKAATAVNEVTIANAATGGAPQISATGEDTDISLKLGGKGAGALMLKSFAFVTQGNVTAKTTSTTLTAVELASGIITVNQGAGGTSALQLPLATSMDSSFALTAANDAFEFSVINTSTVDAEDASVTTNTGWTLVGNMDVHAYSAAGSLNSSARFLARKTGAGAWTLYRIS